MTFVKQCVFFHYRRKSALEDVAVKPLTPAQFPVALEEEVSLLFLALFSLTYDIKSNVLRYFR